MQLPQTKPASSKAQQLQQAEQAALQQSAAIGPTDSIVPCPHQAANPTEPAQQKQRIEVMVLGPQHNPLNAIAVVLSKPSGEQLKSITAVNGKCAFEGLEPGAYEVCLSELDQDCWQLLKQTSLGEKAISEGSASWQPAAAPQESQGVPHEVKQGECIAKLAFNFGLAPDTIWNHPKNAKLKAARKELHILNPKDVVFIPPKTLKKLSVNSGERIELQQQNALEKLRIRFLHYDDTPRTGLPFLVSIKTSKNDIWPDAQGKTDGAGFVIVDVPPNATFAEIILGEGGRQEIHEFDLGFVNPIDTVSGVKARLNNLGFECGEETEEMNELTISAIKAFQRRYGLEVSGGRDDKILALLEEQFGS